VTGSASGKQKSDFAGGPQPQKWYVEPASVFVLWAGAIRTRTFAADDRGVGGCVTGGGGTFGCDGEIHRSLTVTAAIPRSVTWVKNSGEHISGS